MRCKVLEVELDKGKMLFVEPLGDIHFGNVAFASDKFYERVKMIEKDENRYWIGMGDYIDNVRPYKHGVVDKRWTTEVLKGVADWDAQISEIVRMLEPIKNKCLGMLWGNHEWGSMTSAEFEERICKSLGVSFLGSRAFIILRIVNKDKLVGEYSIFAIHGSYGGFRVGGAINRLQDLARIYDADIYLMGHTHSKAFQTEYRIYAVYEDGKYKIVERPILYALTGGFLDPHSLVADQYFDRNPLPRSIRVGTISVGIDPWRGKIHGFE